jgi:hypothetical protein
LHPLLSNTFLFWIDEIISKSGLKDNGGAAAIASANYEYSRETT